MAERQIITIDEDKCTGCGLCVPNCAEGALQIVDGKARLISDLFCDGLGACVGHCPEDAITVVTREAEPYDERRVMEDNIVPAGANTIKTHLDHLHEHGAIDYYNEAVAYLKEKGIPVPDTGAQPQHGGGCPGAAMRDFRSAAPASESSSAPSAQPSELRQWPVQLHLVSPAAPYLKNADLLVAADCTAFTAGEFHSRYLKGKALVIACPKLDDGQDIYRQKLTAMIDQSQVNSISVMVMEVPCCGGLVKIVADAAAAASRKVPLKRIIIGVQGDKLSEEWL